MARNVAENVRKLLLLGHCVPTVKQNATKIRVKRLELDENLLMVRLYFYIIIIMLIKTEMLIDLIGKIAIIVIFSYSIF